MTALLTYLAGDCEQRDVRSHTYDFCGAGFPDIGSGRQPDAPSAAPARAKLRVMG